MIGSSNLNCHYFVHSGSVEGFYYLYWHRLVMAASLYYLHLAVLVIEWEELDQHLHGIYNYIDYMHTINSIAPSFLF